MDWFLTLPKPLVLASGSPRRAQLLRRIGLDFQIEASDIAEVIEPGEDPGTSAERLALEKARHVARGRDHCVVIGADTIVCLDDRILGKPADAADARRMLDLLSDRTHQVVTGLAIVDADSDRAVTSRECTDVTFRALSQSEIRRYVALGECLDKAGAYGIQDESALFVSGISGCFYNVMGLPLSNFYLTLQHFIATPAATKHSIND